MALILSKVEDNVHDAVDATRNASDILAQFEQAKTVYEKGSMEARNAQKSILEERLRQRREAKAKQAADAAEDEALVVDTLPEKWQEVQEELVDQAMESFESAMMTQEQAGLAGSQFEQVALARVLWQLDRDIAHAEELRASEWASHEA